MSDSISRQAAIRWVKTECNPFGKPTLDYDSGLKVIEHLKKMPSAEATKKKAELKENGDWDCPDVYCDECDHHRSVEWCSLAIPSHEKIDDTYKMVNEAFFEGFHAAEKRYRFLIETVEELDKKSADAVAVVRCKDCQYRKKVGTSYYCELDEFNVQDADFCSWGERKEP